MEDLESKCYDKFDFKLEDLQVLIANTGKSYFVWVDVQKVSVYRILKIFWLKNSTSYELMLMQCD